MHSYEEYNKPIQELIKLMKDDYPNDFILEINSFSAEIKSNLSTQVFLVKEPKQKIPYPSRPKKSKILKSAHK